MSEERKVYIVGGGLAGMTVAHELAKQEVQVTILEASHRLGGKAGADYDSELDIHLDHGFHIFPLWYANVRALMEELGIVDRIIDTDTQHTIEPPTADGRPGRWFTNYALTSIPRALHNVRQSPLPPRHGLVGLYFLLDLALEPFRRRGFLDRTSVNGYFRKQYYRHEAVADFHHFLGLQASSIPADAMSAQTFQHVLWGFMRYRTALVGMLKGDLQTQLIQPFQQRLEQLGVRVVFDHRVDRLQMHARRITNLDCVGSSDATAVPLDRIAGVPVSAEDIFVLCTPPERTAALVDADLVAAEQGGGSDAKSLADLHQLVSEPMAALHVVFKRRLPHIPPWHTGFHHSDYGLSMIDISQHWPELQRREQTVLSVIAANFKPLLGVRDPQAQARFILDDLLRYLRHDASGRRVIEDDDILALRLNSNTEVPLFLNTTSSWHYRPDGRTRVANLFVAGDYCRSQADLTSMEGAVDSGIQTARHVLRDLGRDWESVVPRRFEEPPFWLIRLVKTLLWVVVGPLGAFYALARAVEDIRVRRRRDQE